MKFSIVFLLILVAVYAQSASAKVHPHDKVAGAAGAGALLKLKPKVVAGGALVGGALVAKALLLKKPVLIAGGLIAAKLAKKALVVGAGALVAKKLIQAIRAKRPCRRTCANCVRSRTVVRTAQREVTKQEVREAPVVKQAAQRETLQVQQQEATHKIEKRSIADYVNRGFESVSSGIESVGSRLVGFGETFRRGGERLKDVSARSRMAGGFVSDSIRARTYNLLGRNP